MCKCCKIHQEHWLSSATWFFCRYTASKTKVALSYRATLSAVTRCIFLWCTGRNVFPTAALWVPLVWCGQSLRNWLANLNQWYTLLTLIILFQQQFRIDNFRIANRTKCHSSRRWKLGSQRACSSTCLLLRLHRIQQWHNKWINRWHHKVRRIEHHKFCSSNQ